MNEMTPKLPPELEQTLMDYFSGPAPSDGFASHLETQLRQKVEQSRGKPGSFERTSFMKMARTRPIVAVLMALLILLVLSGAAYALGKALGFIPGIGLVEQAISLRTIEAPVLVEREDVRLTVLNVIAGPSNTSVRFQVEFLAEPSDTGDVDTSCQGTPSLVLSDGTSLNFVETREKFTVGETGSNAGYGYVMEFAPIPPDQNDVTFSYPCLVLLVPRPLPSDWLIPFRLIPAPDGMALPVSTMPVTESPIVTETETTNPTDQPQPVVDPNHRITSTIDSFVSIDDGYLLIGSMQWSASDYPAYGVNPVAFRGYINVVDANGEEVPWEEVFGSAIPQDEEFRSYWAIKVLSKTFVSPLTITLNAADVKIPPVPFTFDAGATPQAGQSWDVNQDIQVANRAARVVKANLISFDGTLNFQLDVQVDANVIGDLYINSPLSQCMGGGGGYPTERRNLIPVYIPLCRPDVPPGVVDMQVTGAVLWGEWQVNWQP